jgi:hypothetical protein
LAKGQVTVRQPALSRLRQASSPDARLLPGGFFLRAKLLTLPTFSRTRNLQELDIGREANTEPT